MPLKQARWGNYTLSTKIVDWGFVPNLFDICLTFCYYECTISAIKLKERSQMISLMLVLGISSIFASGVLAHLYGVKGDQRDFYISAIGFASGVYILVSMIGALA